MGVDASRVVLTRIRQAFVDIYFTKSSSKSRCTSAVKPSIKIIAGTIILTRKLSTFINILIANTSGPVRRAVTVERTLGVRTKSAMFTGWFYGPFQTLIDVSITVVSRVSFSAMAFITSAKVFTSSSIFTNIRLNDTLIDIFLAICSRIISVTLTSIRAVRICTGAVVSTANQGAFVDICLTTVARPRCPTIAVVATLGVNTGTVIVARIIETFINICFANTSSESRSANTNKSTREVDADPGMLTWVTLTFVII